MMRDVRIDNGIEVMTMRVLRQDPRNSRIIRAVRQAAMTPSWRTPVIAARTNTLWSNRKATLRVDGRPARILGISRRAWSTTVGVDALALLRMGGRAEWRWTRRTRLGCGLNR